MTILFLNQFFWPDAAATSQLLSDLAKVLKNYGHSVHVICANGRYAGTETSSELETNDPNVNVYRIKGAPFKRSKIGRIVSYASFFLLCSLKALRVPKPDIVITLTTPPLLSLIGTMVKALRNSGHIIWEMDVYPDVAVDLNLIKRDGLLDGFIGSLADYSRHKADAILALGDCMKSRLMARGTVESKIHVAENWADGRAIRPINRTFSQTELTLLYSGNLGLAHDSDTLLEAIFRLKDDVRFQFVFAGGGTLRRQVEAHCLKSALSCVHFRPYCSREQLAASLGSCDIGLITQRASCLGSVVPSKIYGLMAAGRPVIFIGPPGSTVGSIIQEFGCGWQIDNDDVSSLVGLLRLLIEHPSRIEAAAKRARRAFEANFDLPVGTHRIYSVIESLSRERHPEVAFTSRNKR